MLHICFCPSIALYPQHLGSHVDVLPEGYLLSSRSVALCYDSNSGWCSRCPCTHAGEGVGLPEGEAMAGLLKRTLYLASRHKDKKVTSAASTAFNYLLRSSVTAQGKRLKIGLF